MKNKAIIAFQFSNGYHKMRINEKLAKRLFTNIAYVSWRFKMFIEFIININETNENNTNSIHRSRQRMRY